METEVNKPAAKSVKRPPKRITYEQIDDFDSHPMELRVPDIPNLEDRDKNIIFILGPRPE
jgi:hypothetical protein